MVLPTLSSRNLVVGSSVDETIYCGYIMPTSTMATNRVQVVDFQLFRWRVVGIWVCGTKRDIGDLFFL